MTDWLDWLLEELEEEEEQEEDLDLNPYALTGWQKKEQGREAESKWPGETVQAGEEEERKRPDPGPARTGTAAGDLLEAEPEGQSSRTEDGESQDLPMKVKQARKLALDQAVRRMETQAEWSWQEGTPAGTGDVRTSGHSRRTPWLPANGQMLGSETAQEDMERLTAATGAGGELYAAVRRAGTAVEQARGLRQTGPVVIREPVPVSGQGATPAELDRIFQRDARRYDGGFTLF